ncbi:MAG: plasmid pRiA4b ORF-3 family protein, partial [Acidimicrobiales bacterium]
MYFGPVVYVLHVQLEEVEPPIWRRVVVEEDTKLPKLSKILEAAMGWEGYHLHDFQVGDGVIFAGPDLDSDHAIDERKVTVGQILPRDGATLVWPYDFGDSWNHTVTVESRNEPDPDARYPQVLEGARE